MKNSSYNSLHTYNHNNYHSKSPLKSNKNYLGTQNSKTPQKYSQNKINSNNDFEKNKERNLSDGINSISLEDSLVELYLKIKIRKYEEIMKKDNDKEFNSNINDNIEEKINLKKIPSVNLVDYIKNSIDTLIHLKVEEKIGYERRRLIENPNVNLNKSLLQSNVSYEKVVHELEKNLKQLIENEQNLKKELELINQKYEFLEFEYKQLIEKSKLNVENSIKSNFSKSKSKSKENLVRDSKASNFINQSNCYSDVFSQKSKSSKSPINYNFNNPIVIYGDKNFSSAFLNKNFPDNLSKRLNNNSKFNYEDKDTVNVRFFQF